MLLRRQAFEDGEGVDFTFAVPGTGLFVGRTIRVLALSRAVAVGVAIALTAAGGCAGRSDMYSLDQLREMPEAGLVYPDSERIQGLESEGASGIGEHSPFFGARLGARANSADIEAWYEAELAQRGWIDAINTSHGTTETRVVSWRKPGVLFRFSVREKDPEDPRQPAAEVQARFETIYDIVLIADSKRNEPVTPEERRSP